MPTIHIIADLLAHTEARSWLFSRGVQLTPVGNLQLEFTYADTPELTEFLLKWSSWVTGSFGSKNTGNEGDLD
jgi:hypothetical protein